MWPSTPLTALKFNVRLMRGTILLTCVTGQLDGHAVKVICQAPGLSGTRCGVSVVVCVNCAVLPAGRWVMLHPKLSGTDGNLPSHFGFGNCSLAPSILIPVSNP